MDSEQERVAGLLQRKAKRATRAAVIFIFLLALFWSVDAFFVWIFLGAATYSGFLALLYHWQANPREVHQAGEKRKQADSSRPSAVPEIMKSRMKTFLPIMVALVVLAIVARLVVTASSNHEGPSEKNEEDNSESQPTSTTESNDIDLLTTRGNDLLNQGQYDSALFYYNRVLTLDPTNQYAQYDKALAYYSRQDYNRPIPILLRCISQHPNYGEAFWLLGDTYFNLHNIDSAKVCLERAYENGIRSGGFLQLMASLYENDPSRAIALYKESLAQDSSLLDSYRQLAKLEPTRAREYTEIMNRWERKAK